MIEKECPHCGKKNVSEAIRTTLAGVWVFVRQCNDCLRLLNPNGTKRRKEPPNQYENNEKKEEK